MKNKGGRPSKKDSIPEDKLKVLYTKGFTDKEVADFFNITEHTLNNWKNKYPKFFLSIKESKQFADDQVKKSLFERANGYSHPEEKVFCNNGEIITHQTIKHYPPDPTSMIFWLKNRQPKEWREKQEIEVKNFNLSDLVKIAKGEDIETE